MHYCHFGKRKCQKSFHIDSAEIARYHYEIDSVIDTQIYSLICTHNVII